jgi:hypothetical protein
MKQRCSRQRLARLRRRLELEQYPESPKIFFIGISTPLFEETLELIVRARPERILVVPYLLFGGRPVARLREQIRDFENRFPGGSRLNPDARCSVDFATIRLGRDRLAIFIATLGWSRICSVMIGPLVRDGRKGLAYNQSPEQPRNIRRSPSSLWEHCACSFLHEHRRKFRGLCRGPRETLTGWRSGPDLKPRDP